MMSIDINSIAIFNIHIVDCRCIISRISNSEVLNLLKNAELNKKVDYYKTYISVNMNKKLKRNNKIITFGDTEIEKRKFHNKKNIRCMIWILIK